MRRGGSSILSTFFLLHMRTRSNVKLKVYRNSLRGRKAVRHETGRTARSDKRCVRLADASSSGLKLSGRKNNEGPSHC